MQFSRTRSIYSLTILSTAVVFCSSLLTDCAIAQKGIVKINGGSNGGSNGKVIAIQVDSAAAVDPSGLRNRQAKLPKNRDPRQIKKTLSTTLKFGKDEGSANDAFTNGKHLYDSATQMRKANSHGIEHKEVFLKAAKEFSTASRAWPDSSLNEDALFLEGESYYFADDYVQSNRAFEGLIAQYSGSQYLDRAEQRRYSIATYWLDQSKIEASNAFSDVECPKAAHITDAQRILKRIRFDDPTGKLADNATFALASSHMSLEHYEEAADTFSDMRKAYPESEFQFRAQMLELESLLKSYKWLDDDDTRLARAEKLHKQITTQFPIEAEKQREVLAQQSALVKRLRTAKNNSFDAWILASLKFE